jgi:hypothetical protein
VALAVMMVAGEVMMVVILEVAILEVVISNSSRS